MLAIINSGQIPRRSVRFLALTTLLGACALASPHPAVESKDLSAYARHRYDQARKAHQAAPDNPEAGWKFSQACFELAEFSKTHQERETLALEGIQLARQVLKDHAQIAPAHYYLALNLGQLARTRTLTALSLVGEMEAAFQKTITLDARVDFAGAHRNVALIYRDAPGWPVSVGNSKKAKEHLETAVKLFPEYPGNQLTWLESLLDWKQLDSVRDELDATTLMLKKSRQELTGERWTAHWVEWDERWAAIQNAVKVE